MNVIHAYNLHRGGGGADNATLATIATQRQHGFTVAEFHRHSADLGAGLKGKFDAALNGIYARTTVREFTDMINRVRPDVVHVHELYPMLSPWILAAGSRCQVPVVLSCYDYRMTCPITIHRYRGELCTRCAHGREYWSVLRNCRNNYFESAAYGVRNHAASLFRIYEKHVTRFVTPTRFAADWLAQYTNIPRSKFDVVPCQIELPDDPADPATGEYVGFAGRFVPEKGIDILLEAMRELKLPCVIAVPRDSALPAALPQEPWLKIVETRSREELNTFYRRARIHVMPSIWFETFGIVAAESMSYGVPVIASRIGALAETVEDERTGLLFEPGDAADLAASIRRLWHNEQLLRHLGRQAREKVARKYCDQSHAKLLCGVYEQARTDLSR